MTFSALKFSRTRMLALLLVAVLGVSAIGVAATASASTGSAAAKKKGKKCKKGYKKSHGKCKKKKSAKAAPKPLDVLTGVNLALVRQVARTKVQIKGTLTFSKTPAKGVVPAVVNIQTQSSGVIAAQINIQVDGQSATQSFSEVSFTPAFENGKTAVLNVGTTITSNTVDVH